MILLFWANPRDLYPFYLKRLLFHFLKFRRYKNQVAKKPVFSGRMGIEVGRSGARPQDGFTLIEVLLALSVVAIALTALLRTTAQDVKDADYIKEKSIRHWVALQGVNMVQLGLLEVPLNRTASEATHLFGKRWYWRVKLSATALPAIQRIEVSVSDQSTGPFRPSLIAFRYAH